MLSGKNDICGMRDGLRCAVWGIIGGCMLLMFVACSFEYYESSEKDGRIIYRQGVLEIHNTRSYDVTFDIGDGSKFRILNGQDRIAVVPANGSISWVFEWEDVSTIREIDVKKRNYFIFKEWGESEDVGTKSLEYNRMNTAETDVVLKGSLTDNNGCTLFDSSIDPEYSIEISDVIKVDITYKFVSHENGQDFCEWRGDAYQSKSVF